MHFQRLRAFHWVMITGSASKAAERLRLTQPAISRSLSALESELGFRLFVRRQKRLVPTAQGEAFHREAERILFGIDELRRVVRDIRTSRSAPLRVVSMPQLARGLLPEAISIFAKKYSEVKISLEIRERREIEHWIAGLQFDVGIAMLPVKLPTLRTREFVTLAPVAVFAPDHRLAKRGAVEVRELAEEQFIALDQTSMLRHTVDSMFYSNGISPLIRVETSSAAAACEMVSHGLGISIVDPFTAATFARERVSMVPCRTSIRLSYGFVFSNDLPSSAVVTDFTEVVAGLAQGAARAQSAVLEAPAAQKSRKALLDA